MKRNTFHWNKPIRTKRHNSHVFASVSHKQFIRPDKDNKERMLVPDIQTNAEEAYDKAVEFLNE